MVIQLYDAAENDSTLWVTRFANGEAVGFGRIQVCVYSLSKAEQVENGGIKFVSTYRGKGWLQRVSLTLRRGAGS